MLPENLYGPFVIIAVWGPHIKTCYANFPENRFSQADLLLLLLKTQVVQIGMTECMVANFMAFRGNAAHNARQAAGIAAEHEECGGMP